MARVYRDFVICTKLALLSSLSVWLPWCPRVRFVQLFSCYVCIGVYAFRLRCAEISGLCGDFVTCTRLMLSILTFSLSYLGVSHSDCSLGKASGWNKCDVLVELNWGGVECVLHYDWVDWLMLVVLCVQIQLPGGGASPPDVPHHGLLHHGLSRQIPWVAAAP